MTLDASNAEVIDLSAMGPVESIHDDEMTLLNLNVSSGRTIVKFPNGTLGVIASLSATAGAELCQRVSPPSPDGLKFECEQQRGHAGISWAEGDGQLVIVFGDANSSAHELIP